MPWHWTSRFRRTLTWRANADFNTGLLGTFWENNKKCCSTLLQESRWLSQKHRHMRKQKPHTITKPLFSWDTSPETMVCVHARIVRGQFLKGHCLSNCAKCHMCDVDLSMAKNVLCIDPTCPKQGKELCLSESSMFRSTFWSFLNWGFEYCWHLTIQCVARQYLLFQNAFKTHVVIHCCTNHYVCSMKCSFFSKSWSWQLWKNQFNNYCANHVAIFCVQAKFRICTNESLMQWMMSSFADCRPQHVGHKLLIPPT